MEIDYEADLLDKLSKNGPLWDMLEPHAATGAEFSLDYFFYAQSKEVARSVASALSDFGYSSSVRKEGSVLKRIWLTRGATPPMTLTRSGIDEWTRQMVDVARMCGAHFDGWGAALPT